MSKEEYKKIFMTICFGDIMAGNVDVAIITHNDGTAWYLPFGCEEQFSCNEWRNMTIEYCKNHNLSINF